MAIYIGVEKVAGVQHKSNFTESYRRSFYAGPNFNILQETRFLSSFAVTNLNKLQYIWLSKEEVLCEFYV